MQKLILILISAIVFGGCAQPENQTPGIKTNDAQKVRVSAIEADAAEPAIAAGDNAIFVVWVEHGANKNADVFLQKFDLQLKAVGEKMRVNAIAGQATAWRGDAPTVAVKDDSVYVGWTSRVESAASSANDLYLSVSRDGGKTFDAPSKINDDQAPCIHGMHSLAVGANGKIFMAWLDERYLKNQTAEKISGEKFDYLPRGFRYEKIHDETMQDKTKQRSEAKPMQHGEANRETYFSYSIDGGRTFAANRKLAGDVCPCCKTATLAAPDGRIYVAWRQVVGDNFRHIAVASSSDGGEKFSAPVIVSDDRWQIAGCPVSGASLSNGANGALDVLWFSAGTNGATGLYAAQSSDGGATFSPRILRNAGAVSGTPVLLADTAVWSADGKIYLKNQRVEAVQIADGDSLAATSANEKFFVAFVAKENEKRGVWLAAH